MRRAKADLTAPSTPAPRAAFTLKPVERSEQPAGAPSTPVAATPVAATPVIDAKPVAAPTVAETAPQPVATAPVEAAPAVTPAVSDAASTLSRVAVETLAHLAVQIQKRLGDGSTKFQIELKPADLGRVDVALTIAADGKVTARLDFDSPVAAATFSGREHELRQQLAAAGLKLDTDGVTFATRQAETPAQPDTSGFLSDQQAGRQHPSSASRQASRALNNADQVAAEADLDTALLNLRSRQGASRLGLDLTV
ncbi:MAG: flagellar hook-length control protein FliK [Asticcacaulis sp.]|nr:flagellar hook-length control protein FliK [Asticcacaulis sp.]